MSYEMSGLLVHHYIEKRYTACNQRFGTGLSFGYPLLYHHSIVLGVKE